MDSIVLVDMGLPKGRRLMLHFLIILMKNLKNEAFYRLIIDDLPLSFTEIEDAFSYTTHLDLVTRTVRPFRPSVIVPCSCRFGSDVDMGMSSTWIIV